KDVRLGGGSAVNPKLSIQGLTMVFATDGRKLTVLDGVDLDVGANEFVAIVGTSGCGKSTLLSIVGGLTEQTSGEVLIDGRPVQGPGRDRGFVFQSYSLFEWMTVERNIDFALEKSDLGRSERRELVAYYVQTVGLAGFEKALPKQLSGGMRQRVAIARALVYKPSILLMDEPFGAQDAQTRGMMQELLLKVWEEHKATVIFVTHDVEEAIFLADRVIVLASRPGRVKRDLGIALERPRRFDVVTSPEFSRYKRDILADIREETLKVMALDEVPSAMPT